MIKWLKNKILPVKKDITKAESPADGYLQQLKIIENNNSRRLNYLKETLTEKQKSVFNSIPLILHETSPGLPGNDWSVNLPGGLACYDPSNEELSSFRSFFPESQVDKRAKMDRQLQFLCIMGSAGTASFTPDSDIDFWVGINQNIVGADACQNLHGKLRAIEKWCLDTADLAVHFFITDPLLLQNDNYGEAVGESCGSALGKLLKDEFYRTAIFICGKRPWYWLAPIGLSEESYLSTIQTLNSTTGFPSSDFIDLGHIHALYQDEFAGAILWHLNKSLSSPFKSLLKIAHLDTMAMGLLKKPMCEYIKESIISNTGTSTDPYFLFADSLRTSYLAAGMRREARLVEMAYFIKSLSGISENLSDMNSRTALLLRSITSSWNIPEKEFVKLMNFREWSGQAAEEVRKSVVQFLIGTYSRIQKTTNSSNNKITQNDTLILGRKFRSFFEQKENKIPFEFISLTLSKVSHTRLAEKDGEWYVYVRTSNAKLSELHLLRKFDSSLHAIAFIMLNGLPYSTDSMTLKGHIRFNKTEATHLIKMTKDFFGELSIDKEDNREYLKPARYKKIMIIVNWEQPEWNRGVASLALFAWNYHAEFFVLNYTGSDWKRWLLGEVLQNLVGRQYLKECTFLVHRVEDKLGNRQKISDDVAETISTYVATSQT